MAPVCCAQHLRRSYPAIWERLHVTTVRAERQNARLNVYIGIAQLVH